MSPGATSALDDPSPGNRAQISEACAVISEGTGGPAFRARSGLDPLESGAYALFPCGLG